jgi:ABC-2 type transport system permease protein
MSQQVARALPPAGTAAPRSRAIVAMAAMELRLALRRGETLVATAVLPVVVLAFFSSVSILPVPAGRPVDFLLPGSIAFAIIATSLVSLGITTAYDRYYGVLKRLGGSPLSRGELIAAKILAVLVVEIVQAVLLVVVAAGVLGWTPSSGVSIGLASASLLLGTLAFAGVGLLLAGILRAETMLAVANLLFVASLVLGGIILPLDHLPAPLANFAAALPASALTDAFRIALGGAGDTGGPLGLLAGWGVGSVLIAARTFRWE